MSSPFVKHFDTERSDSPTPSTRHVLWVDDKMTADMQAILRSLERRGGDLRITHVVSTSELMVWISRNEKLVRNDAVRIITNRYRSHDGGDNAARNLISLLRKEPSTAHLKVLVFCQNTDKAQDLEDKKHTFVSNNGETMTNYCQWNWPEKDTIKKSIYKALGKAEKGDKKDKKKDKEKRDDKEKDRVDD